MAEKEIKIKTPYGVKNWSFVKRCFDAHGPLLEAVKYATALLKSSGRYDQVHTEPLERAIKLAEGK